MTRASDLYCPAKNWIHGSAITFDCFVLKSVPVIRNNICYGDGDSSVVRAPDS